MPVDQDGAPAASFKEQRSALPVPHPDTGAPRSPTGFQPTRHVHVAPTARRSQPPTLQPTVLVVEDEEAFVEALTVGLAREGFRVQVARDGVAALEMFDAIRPDVVLLDVLLPKVSGLDVCRELRKRSQVPIIMVTAKGSEIDAVVGLEVGADDYVTKPYRLRELIARMRAVMRRQTGTEVALPVDALQVGDVTLDPERHEVRIRGVLTPMPLKEFELLHVLLANADRVMTRTDLIDLIWGFDYVGDTKTLDVHVKRLRAKVETDPANPRRIVTIRGLGYKYAT
jgi:two-component system response regulator RegX3